MVHENVLVVFFSLNGIKFHSYRPNLVIIVVFFTSSKTIRIYQNLVCKSNFENHLECPNWFKTSSIRERSHALFENLVGSNLHKIFGYHLSSLVVLFYKRILMHYCTSSPNPRMFVFANWLQLPPNDNHLGIIRHGGSLWVSIECLVQNIAPSMFCAMQTPPGIPQEDPTSIFVVLHSKTHLVLSYSWFGSTYYLLQSNHQILRLYTNAQWVQCYFPISIASKHLPLQLHILSNQHNHHPQRIIPQEGFNVVLVVSNSKFT
jgi:hypothetical protein